jgi:regulator of protease activity HflC (stomatin/prohibitin superfamily)
MDIILRLLLLCACAIVVLSVSIKVVRDDQRIVILRFGKPLGVRGPGIVMILPFVDRITRVTLNESIPGWETLTEQQLEEKLMAHFIHPTGDV